MQYPALLKLFELHILDYLKEKYTDANLLLKETIGSYVHKKNKAYGLFVDLSKTFDITDPFILLKKLWNMI